MSDDLPADLYADALHGPDDGSTLLEPLEMLQAEEHHTAFEPHQTAIETHHTAFEPHDGTIYAPLQPARLPSIAKPPAEEAFRPKLRPRVPLLTILDDGETALGETIRIREATTLIGRNEGAVRLPNDQRISARHADIVRTEAGPTAGWVLRDLDSKTGTFVRCSGTDLRPDRLIVLGSRRFRFQWPQRLRLLARTARCSWIRANSPGRLRRRWSRRQTQTLANGSSSRSCSPFSLWADPAAATTLNSTTR